MSNFPDLLTSFGEAVEALKVKLSQNPESSTTYNGELIQSIAKDVEDMLSPIQAMVQGRLAYETKAEMDTAGAPPEGTILAEVWKDLDELSNGLYGWTGIAWEKSPYDIKAYTRLYTEPLFENMAEVTNTNAEINQFDALSKPIPECNPKLKGSTWNPSSGTKGWTAGFRVNTYRSIDDLGIYIANSALGVHEFRVKVYKRKLDVDNHNHPGTLEGDEFITSKTIVLSPGDAPAGSGPKWLKTGITFNAYPDFVYYVTWESYDGSGAEVACSGVVQDDTDDIDKDKWPSLRGWYKTTAWNRYTSGLFPILVFESFSPKSLVNTTKESNSIARLSREYLGTDEQVVKSDIDANPNNSDIWDQWIGSQFWRWGQVFKLKKSGNIGAIRAHLNAQEYVTGTAPTDTRYIRVSIYRTDPIKHGDLTPSTLFDYGREQVYQQLFPISLSDKGKWYIFPIHFSVEQEYEYGVVLEGVRDNGEPAALGMSRRREPENIIDDRFYGMYSAYDNYVPATAPGYIAIELVEDLPLITPDKFSALMESVESVPVSFYENKFSGGGWQWGIAPDDAFRRWAIGYVPEQEIKASIVTFSLHGASNSSELRLRIYQRSKDNMNELPGGSGDIVIFDKTYVPLDIGATSGWLDYKFDISDIGELLTSNSYVFEIGLSDSAIESGVGGLGCGRSNNISDNDPQWKRGWYSYSKDPSNMVWGHIAQGSVLAINLEKNIYQPSQKAAGTFITAHPTITKPGEVKQTAPFQITIEETHLSGLSGVKIIPRTVLNFDPPSNVKSVSAEYTLKYSQEARLYYHPAERLPWTHIRNVTVIDGATELKHGLDWDAWFDGAKIKSMKDEPDKTVTITYDGYMARYDLVVYDLVTGELSIIKGTDRKYDADQYMPENSSPHIPIYKAMVHGDTVEVIPLYPWEGPILVGTEAEYQRRLTANRGSLSKLLSKLENGQNITMVGYGDSITAGSHSLGYYEFYPQDTKDKWGDDYKRFGWNQRLQDFLQERFGITVNYINKGIGGSSSRPDGPNGGSYPGRLDPVVNLESDLVVIAFGMNEISSKDTAKNMVNIIKAFQEKGTDVIVLSTPQVNSIGGMPMGDKWNYTNDLLYQAAVSTGAAYVSTSYIAHPSRLGGMGMSQMHMCNSNQFNHPGPYDLKQYGNALCEIFK